MRIEQGKHIYILTAISYVQIIKGEGKVFKRTNLYNLKEKYSQTSLAVFLFNASNWYFSKCTPVTHFQLIAGGDLPEMSELGKDTDNIVGVHHAVCMAAESWCQSHTPSLFPSDPISVVFTHFWVLEAARNGCRIPAICWRWVTGAHLVYVTHSREAYPKKFGYTSLLNLATTGMCYDN